MQSKSVVFMRLALVAACGRKRTPLTVGAAFYGRDGSSNSATFLSFCWPYQSSNRYLAGPLGSANESKLMFLNYKELNYMRLSPYPSPRVKC